MKVLRNNEVKVEEITGNQLFRGRVYKQSLIDEKTAEGLRVIMVNFDPGARTVFHTHTFEQVLHVTDGKGIVATEKEEHVVTPGAIVFIPAGELHWHGAIKDTSFSHISITTPGQTNF